MGNTSRCGCPKRRSSVHPHACGEYLVVLHEKPVARGSPPRLWGILHEPIVPLELHRFTPTPVGNTPPCGSRAASPPVHPHACGEYAFSSRLNWLIPGSPPRLWGIRRLRRCGRHAARFTPTPVGNTSWPVRQPSRRPVHPHACGEYVRFVMFRSAICGSPPRLWGIRVSRRNRITGIRFTPTPVGNTWSVAALIVLSPVHPHACGEYAEPQRSIADVGGSPPRLWGIRATSCRCLTDRRFTPTPVGNTFCARGN